MTKEVMKKALEALKNTSPLGFNPETDKKFYATIDSLEEALKQEQGEQLARLGWQEIDCPICGGGARVFPKQEQERGEPVGSVMSWVDGSLIHGWFGEPPPEGTLLYIKPQYRKPLTFEQVEDCFGDGVIAEENGILISAQWLHDFARAIESAHGIKEYTHDRS